MDTVKTFDILERKIEKLLGRLRQLETENEKLRQDADRTKAELAAARKVERESSDSRGLVERLEKDQEAVRGRLEKLIQSLEAAEGAGKA